jgi:hypothetical protein
LFSRSEVCSDHITAAPTRPSFRLRSKIGPGNEGGTSYGRNQESGDRNRCGGRHRQGNDARALLAAGIQVAGVDRDREPLEALAGSAREQGKGSELLTIQTDLAKDSAAEEITEATHDRFSRIDILVNNAGIGPPGSNPIR